MMHPIFVQYSNEYLDVQFVEVDVDQEALGVRVRNCMFA